MFIFIGLLLVAGCLLLVSCSMFNVLLIATVTATATAAAAVYCFVFGVFHFLLLVTD